MQITTAMLQSEIDRVAANARHEKRYLHYFEVERILNLFDQFPDAAEITLPSDVIEPNLRGMIRAYLAEENEPEYFIPVLAIEEN